MDSNTPLDREYDHGDLLDLLEDGDGDLELALDGCPAPAGVGRALDAVTLKKLKFNNKSRYDIYRVYFDIGELRKTTSIVAGLIQDMLDRARQLSPRYTYLRKLD